MKLGHRCALLLPRIALSLTLLSSVPRSVAETYSGAASAPDVDYVLHWLDDDQPTIEIVVLARGASDGQTTFAVAEEWGGFASCGKDLADVTVRGVGDRVLPHEHPKDHEWVVRHDPDEALTFTYRLRESPDRAPAHRANDYRPIITRDLVHVIGNHGIIYPKHLANDEPRSIRLSWHDFNRPGWKVVSSFGAGRESRTVRLTLDEFRNSLFLAGKIRLHERALHGNRIGVAIHGEHWRFEDAAFVELVTRIIETQRAFFNDWADPWYLVSLIPSGPDDPHSLSLGGTGLTNCFALFVSRGASMELGSPGERRMARLLMHEYFHRWNGGRIDFPEPEGGMYWFSEGFTDFYARRLLLRSGLFDIREYLEDLNESLRNYYLSPVREVPNARIVEDFWKDPEVQTLPYRRGDLLALWIDHRIRTMSNGARSLDDLMRQLLTPERRPRTRIDLEFLTGLMAQHTDPAFAETVRRSVEEGGLIQLPDDIGQPDFQLITRQAHRFELGFDDEATRKERKVVGVRPGSAAERAGLRNGQALTGWSLEPGNPDREVELTFLEDNNRKVIRYLPQGDPIEIPAFRASTEREP
jgi:predicted metalloprotease with PDZ domain